MGRQKRQVLLVDDEPDILLTVGKRLEVAGFEVRVARNGDEAFAKAREEPPDIVIVDLLLPGRTGVEICAAFRQDEQLRHLPIILYSSRWDEKDEKLLRDSRADAHVTKMQGTTVLIEQINAILGRAAGSESLLD